VFSPTHQIREKVMSRYKLACHLQRFLLVHDQVANQFMHCRYNREAKQERELRQAFDTWNAVTCTQMTVA
jgi:putative transposase